MQQNAEMEKMRQEQLLQDKLLKKKAKRAKGLQQKHDLALQSKMLEQVNEVDLAIGAAPNEEGEDEDMNDASTKAAAEDFSHKLEGQNAKFEEELKAC